MANDTNTNNQEVQIDSKQDDLKGAYVNAVKVAVTDSEVIVDSAFIFPEDEKKKKGIIVNRNIMNHDMASKLAQSLISTLEEHTKKKK